MSRWGPAPKLHRRCHLYQSKLSQYHGIIIDTSNATAARPRMVLSHRSSAALVPATTAMPSNAARIPRYIGRDKAEYEDYVIAHARQALCRIDTW